MTTTKRFGGFPSRGMFTPVHNAFFSSLLPDIEDMAELKATLHVMWAVYRKKGYPRYVSRAELLADAGLMRGLSAPGRPGAESLGQALALAAARGTLLQLKLNHEGQQQELYFLNTPTDRAAVERISSGELPVYGFAVPQPGAEPERRDIFSLYEANIGLLTPLIAEDLKEAERLYPADWIQEAFQEAVALNKRSWRYIARILERWSTEGKDHGKPGRRSEKADPDRYFQGKYGKLLRGP